MIRVFKSELYSMVHSRVVWVFMALMMLFSMFAVSVGAKGHSPAERVYFVTGARDAELEDVLERAMGPDWDHFVRYIAILMIVCHLTFAFVLPATQSALIAYLGIILLGISFSLVPAALWPSVPKLVDNRLLGSAYAVIFWIQNIGLYAFPMIIGSVLKNSNPGVDDPLKYNYEAPMIVFASLGVLALILGFWLKMEDRRKHYGLEEPNIKK